MSGSSKNKKASSNTNINTQINTKEYVALFGDQYTTGCHHPFGCTDSTSSSSSSEDHPQENKQWFVNKKPFDYVGNKSRPNDNLGNYNDAGEGENDYPQYGNQNANVGGFFSKKKKKKCYDKDGNKLKNQSAQELNEEIVRTQNSYTDDITQPHVVKYPFNTITGTQEGTTHHDITSVDFVPSLIESSHPHENQMLLKFHFSHASKKDKKALAESLNHNSKADLVKSVKLTLTSNFPEQLLISLPTVSRDSQNMGELNVFKVVDAGLLASSRKDGTFKSKGPQTIDIFKREITEAHLAFIDLYAGQTPDNFMKKPYTSTIPNDNKNMNVSLGSVIVGMFNEDQANEGNQFSVDSNNAHVNGESAPYCTMTVGDYEKYSKIAKKVLENLFTFSDVTSENFMMRFTPIVSTTHQKMAGIKLNSEKKSNKSSKEETKAILKCGMPSFDNFFATYPTLNPETCIGFTNNNNHTGLSQSFQSNNADSNNGEMKPLKLMDVFRSQIFHFTGQIEIEYFQSKTKNT
jgi:hypothetical protein